MKALATLVLLLHLGPLAGPALCHAQATCGMPEHQAAVTAPGADTGMPAANCAVIQLCSPTGVAVAPAAVRLEPALGPHDLALPGGAALVAGRPPTPPAPPPRA